MPSISPADMALDLNIPQRLVRDALRAHSANLERGTSQWELTDEQLAAVRQDLSDSASIEPIWTLQVGDTVRRRAIHARFGGQQQGGISTPRSVPDILIFSTPSQGSIFGYNQHEGYRDDGSFAYTGEGQNGDQQFRAGNRALRDANKKGRPIRLFTTKGVNATYVGSFSTGDPTCWFETIPDVNGIPRRGIIFNLIAVDADLALYEPASSSLESKAQKVAWRQPDPSDVVVVQEEALPPGERVVSRLEFELQARFGAWLAARGTPPSGLRLRVGATTIEPDFYVEAEGWIVEAKKSTARTYVRTAIGQVLDYVHVSREAGWNAKPVILLPGHPARDLVRLIHDLSITLAIAEDDGFVILPPSAPGGQKPHGG